MEGVVSTARTVRSQVRGKAYEGEVGVGVIALRTGVGV